jgi:hypothetical protein
MVSKMDVLALEHSKEIVDDEERPNINTASKRRVESPVKHWENIRSMVAPGNDNGVCRLL